MHIGAACRVPKLLQYSIDPYNAEWVGTVQNLLVHHTVFLQLCTIPVTHSVLMLEKIC